MPLLVPRRNAQAIDQLHPLVQPKVREMLRTAAIDNLDLLITDGYRSPEEQDRLYAMGRTITSHAPCYHSVPPGQCLAHPLGGIVTKVRGGRSWHNCGRAVDVAFLMGPGQTVTWPKDRDPVWPRLARHAEEAGLEWGYALWGWDRPHFMFRLDESGRTMRIEQAMREWQSIRKDLA